MYNEFFEKWGEKTDPMCQDTHMDILMYNALENECFK